jgi:hypothetical protein
MFHLIVNLVSVTPMLDMFEREHGTLTTLALFIGRESASLHEAERSGSAGG